MFENKKIFILGMARSGYQVAKLLSKYNNEIVITDSKDQAQDHVKELEELSVQFIKSDNPEDLLDDSFDLVVKNPGIRYDHPLILKAIDLNIKVVNEVEVAYHFLPKNSFIIAVTGSNGKTTTTTLCYEFVRAMKKPVHLGGNIGYPLSQIVEEVKDNDVVVLEISAQQLHDLYDFKPNVSILTNLIPVHLDFFGDYDTYKNHKAKIFMNHTNNDIAVLNAGDEDEVNLTKNIKSKKIYFSSKGPADCYIKDDAIYYEEEEIIKLSDIKLKGMHNYENIMCAIIATKQLGIKNETIREVLRKFKGVDHRIEFVRKLSGVEFYNDSKATNVKSTSIAVNSFDSPVILLLGGYERNHSFEDLKEDLAHLRHIVCYGENKYRIKEFCDKYQMPCTVLDNLEESINFAYDMADPGNVVLLSPACAAWDQFENFEKRGQKFKEVVNSLKEK